MLLIIVTYLAGVLTILSPCILPVLPFVFSRSQQSFVKSGLPLLAGMSVTFALFSALAVVGGQWIAQANEVGRVLAMILLTLFALTLIFPRLSERLLNPLTRLGSKIGKNSEDNTFGGSFVIGIGTGLLWAPCAGPILGLVLTGAASQGDTAKSIGLLLAYSLGAATSLALALVAGNKFLGSLKKFLGVDQVIKKVLGVAVLVGVAAIAFHLDRTVLSQFSKVETASLENKLLNLVEPHRDLPINLADEGPLPELTGAIAWINSPALTRESLKGKVVLVDFWTYSCINCLRSLPHIKALAEKYKKNHLIVIGVHTPEFAFEKSTENVEKAVKDLGIEYPVAVDSDYKIWRAFQNHYWPAHYLIDAQGKIRDHHYGEGEYEATERVIRKLLIESGEHLDASPGTLAETMVAPGVEAAGSNTADKSPETYVGFERAEHFGSLEKVKKNERSHYSFPKADLKRNEWALDGVWQVGAEQAISQKPHGKIRFQFHARDLHLVLGGVHSVKFKVTVDGKAPGKNHGADIDENGMGEVGAHRLYQLIRQTDEDAKSDHLFEIEFLGPQVEAFAFTFG